MPITNDAELASAVAEAGSLLQQMQDYAGQQFSPFAQVRFPRGYIRTAEQARDQFPFLPASAFKSNLSYAMMLCDIQQWLLARTDLFGTAKEMVVKLQIFMLGNVAGERYQGATAGQMWWQLQEAYGVHGRSEAHSAGPKRRA